MIHLRVWRCDQSGFKFKFCFRWRCTCVASQMKGMEIGGINGKSLIFKGLQREDPINLENDK